MKNVDIRDLPSCDFSPQCLRLIDDLDLPTLSRQSRQLSYIHDLQDERQLRQLRSHVPGCPTCSALLAEARHMRTQQRSMLYLLLLANEKRTPSTSESIFAALRREQNQDAEHASRPINPYQLELVPAPPGQFAGPPTPVFLSSRSRPPQNRSLLQNILTVATVAVVLLAAVGLLNHMANQPLAPKSQPHAPALPGAASYGWGSVVIGLTLLSASGLAQSFTIYNFDTDDGRMTTLPASTHGTSKARLEGVSPDGQHLLYTTTYPNHQTTYVVFSPPANTRSIYQLHENVAGNAIWMDREYVLVQNTRGTVLKLDAYTGSIQSSWTLRSRQLAFYHQPFLYFIGEEHKVLNVLYRVNLAQANSVPQRVIQITPDSRFWLSPDGTTVFYANTGLTGEEGIYAVSNDGSNSRLLRRGPGLPIGYADDNALMLLQQVGERIEVIKLGATSAQKELVVFSNAAPQATSLCGPAKMSLAIALCDQDIALAPYGHGLLLHAYYADGSHSLVYDDLAAGTSQKIFALTAHQEVQLPGWSRFSGTTATPDWQRCLCA